VLLKWEEEATTTTYYRRLIETLFKIFITYVQKLLPKQTLAFFSHVKCENLKLLQILFYLTWSAAKPVKDSNQSNPIDWFAQTVTENFFFLKSSMLSHVRPSSVFCLHSFFDEIVRIPSTSNTWNASHSAGLLCLVNTICPWVFCFEKKSKNAKTKFVTLKLRMRCCCLKGLS
jgi:hypothetical protein